MIQVRPIFIIGLLTSLDPFITSNINSSGSWIIRVSEGSPRPNGPALGSPKQCSFQAASVSGKHLLNDRDLDRVKGGDKWKGEITEKHLPSAQCESGIQIRLWCWYLLLFTSLVFWKEKLESHLEKISEPCYYLETNVFSKSFTSHPFSIYFLIMLVT